MRSYGKSGSNYAGSINISKHQKRYLCLMDIIKKYFPALSENQERMLGMLGNLYADWNIKVNTVSRKDIGNIYERHVLSSLSIAKVITFKPGTRVIDVGTGGGFPGIPLAILFPEVDFLLIDSIGKKIKVVEAVTAELGLKNVVARQERFEKVRGKFDFVVSRAVTAIPQFVIWSRGKIDKNGFNDLPNGILYLKGGDFTSELMEVRMHSKVYEISKFFEEEFFETKKVVHLWEPLNRGRR
jgi:16S rRNA (guanine527-N7)-methyltransferase